MKRSILMSFLLGALMSVPANAQMSMRDSIFRAQDAYQQGKLMGEGDASGLLGIVGNLLPDEGGTFSLPGAVLTGAFGLLGSAQSARARAREKMEQEHSMMSQYLSPGGYQTMPYGQMGTSPGPFPPGGYGAPLYPGNSAGWAQPAPVNVPVRRAEAVIPAPRKPAPSAPEKIVPAPESPAPSAEDLSTLSLSLDGSFASEFSEAAAPAAPEISSPPELEKALENAFDPIVIPSDEPKM